MICVEGGGETNATKVQLRNGFAQFFRKALPNVEQSKVVACGGRDNTIALFNRAQRQRLADVVIMLIDSDGVVPEGMSAKEYLQRTLGRPLANAKEDEVHLMVQCMEAWFLADIDALAQFYGEAVRKSKQLRYTDIEQISDAEARLKKSTRNTSKGEYLKSHGFMIIGMIDPDKVRKAANHCNMLLEKLERELEERK